MRKTCWKSEWRRLGNMTTDYEACLEELNRIPQFMPLTGVERCEVMLKALENPQEGIKIIHVAGTNGKGSVCAYIESVLRKCGYKVGLFTSPHLVDIRERIKINGQMIDKEAFARGYDAVKVTQQDVKYAYFDYLLGIALCSFKEAGVEFAVIETGLGGRLDATNALNGKILNVITGVSLEHTAILGDTVEKIAAEKAGIVKSGVPVVYMDKDEYVSAVIRKRACQEKSPCVEVGQESVRIIKNTGKSIDFSVHNRYYKNDCFTISTGAVYQVENCLVALTVLGYLQEAGYISMDKHRLCEGVKDTFWAGRMEEVCADVYVDGAHNPEGIDAFVRSAKAIAQGRRACLFFSVVNDKDYTAMIRHICESEVFETYVVTQIEGGRMLSGQRIMDVFKQYTKKKVFELDNVKEGFEFARAFCASTEAVCFCAGSLYLVGDIKAILA